MTLPPALPSKAIGDKITASDYNNYTRAAVNALITPECASVYRSTVQSIPTATWTTISWEAEDYDAFGMWDVADPTKLTVKIAGLFQVSTLITFAANATSTRLIRVFKNGTSTQIGAATLHAVSSNAAQLQWSGDVRLAANDYIVVQVFHGVGAALNVQNGAAVTNLQARFVSA